MTKLKPTVKKEFKLYGISIKLDPRVPEGEIWVKKVEQEPTVKCTILDGLCFGSSDDCHIMQCPQDRCKKCGRKHAFVCQHKTEEPKDTCTCREIDFNEPGIYDKSDCPVHCSPQPKEEWEEEFDEKFKFNFSYWLNEDGVSPGQIKHFIRNLLQAEREKVIEKINKITIEKNGIKYAYMNDVINELKEAGDE